MTFPLWALSQGKVRTIIDTDCLDSGKHSYAQIIIENQTYSYQIFKVEGDVKHDTATYFGKSWIFLKDFKDVSRDIKKKIAQELITKYSFRTVNFLADCEIFKIIQQTKYPKAEDIKNISSRVQQYSFKDF